MVHPLASAEAVSPPATENANGKLLAPKIPTGPNAFCIDRISTFGIGWRSGSAVSILASTHEPSRNKLPKSFNCPIVRPRSPVILPAGKPDSAQHRSINESPNARISSAIASKKSAFSNPLFLL